MSGMNNVTTQEIRLSFSGEYELITLPDKIKDVYSMNANAYTVIIGSKMGAVDNRGRLFIPVNYSQITPLNEKLFKATKSGLLGVKYEIYHLDKGLVLDNCDQIMECAEGRIRFCQKQWGFIDEEGQVIVPPIYATHADFQEGLAFVGDGKKDGKYIDINGNTVFTINASQGFLFHNGLAVFEVNGLRGVIDRQGNIVLVPTYQKMSDYRYGLFAVSENSANWGVIDVSGKVIVPPKYPFVEIREKDIKFGHGEQSKYGNTVYSFLVYGLMDHTGKEILAEKYMEILQPSEGFAAFRAWENGTACSGYRTMDGQEIMMTKPTFTTSILLETGGSMMEYLRPHSEGLAFARNPNDYGKEYNTGLFYVIDNMCRPISSKGFLAVAWDFKNGYACVCDKPDRYYLIDRNLNRLTPDYTEIHQESHGRYIGKRIREKTLLGAPKGQQFYDIMDEDLQIIASIPSDAEEMYIGSDGIIEALVGGMIEFLDINGCTVMRSDYKAAMAASFYREDIGMKPKLIGTNIWLVPPSLGEKMPEEKISLRESHFFTEGLAEVTNGNKYGFIDQTGRLVIPIEFDSTRQVKYNRVIVNKNNRFYILRRKGQIEVVDSGQVLESVELL
ncbi:DNA-binding transcriptional regulator/RsmH inhibitor MraZ [Lachnospiraceae bacterium PF1-21]|uniref:WG repeat-containing protein n=1 Tax=Ohessyouella blattaphilus TaxID=2949333 RepID=UPI003E2E7445